MFLGIGRNTVTLPTSKVIPINFPLSNIIFRMDVSNNLDKCAMERTKQNYTVSPQNSEPKNLQQHASILHKVF